MNYIPIYHDIPISYISSSFTCNVITIGYPRNLFWQYCLPMYSHITICPMCVWPPILLCCYEFPLLCLLFMVEPANHLILQVLMPTIYCCLVSPWCPCDIRTRYPPYFFWKNWSIWGSDRQWVIVSIVPTYATVWWFGTWFLFFHSVGNSTPNWRTPSFFRGVGWKHQPVKQCEGKSTWMEIPQEMARKNWGTSELRNIDGNGGVYQWKIQILKIVLKIMIQNFHFPFKYLDI